MDNDSYTINCTGDACVGDQIMFEETVYHGSFRKPIHVGKRQILAIITKDSYGAEKQQHTFTLEIVDCIGKDKLTIGSVVRRKGRNVYRFGTWRKPWDNEDTRKEHLKEKHNRGSIARHMRDERRTNMF